MELRESLNRNYIAEIVYSNNAVARRVVDESGKSTSPTVYSSSNAVSTGIKLINIYNIDVRQTQEPRQIQSLQIFLEQISKTSPRYSRLERGIRQDEEKIKHALTS